MPYSVKELKTLHGLMLVYIKHSSLRSHTTIYTLRMGALTKSPATARSRFEDDTIIICTFLDLCNCLTHCISLLYVVDDARTSQF